MSKNIAYLRVSTDKQVDGSGFDRQSQACQAQAARDGAELSATWFEPGASGCLEIDQRVAFARLLKHHETEPIGAIYVECIDRLARDVLVCESSLRLLKERGIRCICSTTGMELTADESADPTRKLLRQLLAVVAEFNKNWQVYRMREGRKAKRLKTGRCEGTKPYGHYAHERLGQARLRELYDQRQLPGGRRYWTWLRIASTLNAEGFTNRAGKPFGPGSVHKMCRQFSAKPAAEGGRLFPVGT